MKELDRKFLNLVGEVKALSEKELYYRIRRKMCIRDSPSMMRRAPTISC